MSVRPIIDALDFARNAGAQHGKIALSGLGRLQDYLAENSGELRYEITGALNRNAKPILQISVQGLIKLRCQRCLDELGHMLDLRTELLLAENEQELTSLDEDESVDGILAEPDLDVFALIEDEIILSLPISPRHDESECSIGSQHNVSTAEQKPHFAALAALKKLH
ncbi:YceD family protein [Nitrosovibrio tenuis]|uniref:Large ribosomal RNA subunit accumulation protein YceD n=1 Tax=Nitrosovibrio tenuis TaxID=1233 RepID=A0A1H7KZ66_9PROT|nr:YceD family protein [Nitrosovibrio tenuis]SEK91277.1 uncharacterized protein SAMN05216387_103366 [Nitrosovibrio tenuis]